MLLKNILAITLAGGLMFSGQQQVPKGVTVVPRSGPLQGVTAYTDSYALIIGVGNYSDPARIPNIPSAPNDAKTIRDVLVNRYGFNPDPDHTLVLTDKDATKQRIEAEVARLCDTKRVRETDRVFVFYSGHGQSIKTRDGRNVGYLVPFGAKIDLSDIDNPTPYQTSCVKMDSIVSQLEESPANHRALVLDACFSGLAVGQDIPANRTFEAETIKEMLNERGLFILTAGSAKESVAGVDDANGLSLFTRALVETLTDFSRTKEMPLIDEVASETKAKTIQMSRGKQKPLALPKVGAGSMLLFPVAGTTPVATNTNPLKKLPTTAGLVVRATPATAKIEVDGNVVGPSSSQELEPGGKKKVIVKVSAPGFVTEGYEVEIVAGKTIPISVELKAVKSSGGINYAAFVASATLSGHSDVVYSVCFSPDGNTVASGSEDNTIKLWDARTGTLKKTLKGLSKYVFSVCFSPDGNTIASGDNYTIKLWDAKTGTLKTTLTGHSDTVRSVCFSPDGNTIASGSDDNTIKLWDARTGTLKTTLTGHSSWVHSVCFSPDGNTIASGSSDDTIKLWDARTGTLTTTLKGLSKYVYSVCFSPDGNTIASGDDYTIKLWDARTGTLKTTLTGHSGTVLSVCFSPDGNTVASGSYDRTFKLWDARTGTLKTTLTGHSYGVNSVCFSPDGNTIASGSDDNTIKLWRMPK